MCLAIPLKIVEKTGLDAVGEVDGIRRAIRLDFTPAATLGDYVIVHAGFAIETLGAEQARQNLAALREVADALQ
ncbi:MAG: HypC/HybG/HupF family hydrogenase formation chaperone [Gemmiger sp.]|nr:HypC/HybG/HupF family hydrogenase formation chaperone [Gemmiger sp.]